MPAYKDTKRNTWLYEFKILEDRDYQKLKKLGFNTKKEALGADYLLKKVLTSLVLSLIVHFFRREIPKALHNLLRGILPGINIFPSSSICFFIIYNICIILQVFNYLK